MVIPSSETGLRAIPATVIVLETLKHITAEI
jgi:hypothetical protein